MLVDGQTPPYHVHGESLVLHGEVAANLSFSNIQKGTVSIRSTFSADEPGLIIYKEGDDYLVDYELGTIKRTKKSKIPDFSQSSTYGLKDFFHENFPNGTSNKPYFVWVDYEAPNGSFFAFVNNQQRFLINSREKLERGGVFKIASYGDSITAGGEASKTEFYFTQRYATFLQKEFPNSSVELVDYSIPGYSSAEGLAWFYEKPANSPTPALGASMKLDLVMIGFGMNDHNLGRIEPKEFESNLIKLARLVKKKYGADVIFFSALPPNENWHYGTHRMRQYADATRMAAIKTNSAYVDVFAVWQKVLTRKDQSSLLGNDINHPNDFGHWLYSKAFEAMTF